MTKGLEAVQKRRGTEVAGGRGQEGRPHLVVKRQRQQQTEIRSGVAAAEDGEVVDGEVVDGNMFKLKKIIGEMVPQVLAVILLRLEGHHVQLGVRQPQGGPHVGVEQHCHAKADEHRLLEASMAYIADNPIMSHAEFDELKIRLKELY